MGPRRMAVDDRQSGRQHMEQIYASMGPRRMAVDDPWRQHRTEVGYQASMGPRRMAVDDLSAVFAGETDSGLLQWGHGAWPWMTQ